MKEYIYDGSFEGLLTSIFYAYSNKEKVLITRYSHYKPHLMDEPIEILCEADKFDRVYTSIETKLSPSILKTIYSIYLSESIGSENLILDYLKLCYTYGIEINLAKNNDIIIAVDMLSRKVTHEAHQFTGFIRFSEVSPMYFYSKIEPDYHILPLITKHFMMRFSDQYFIIHDVRRKIAFIYTQEDAYLKLLTEEENADFLKFSSKDEYEELFKSFYKSTTILERFNPKLHNRLMPMRYRKYLVELT